MENKKYKVRLNSYEKIEELLQEIYDQACKQLNEIQNEMNKLVNSTNLGADDFTMDDKSKYFKAIHDLTGDRKSAIQTKLDIAKFMGEIVKYKGDCNSAINDKNIAKRTSLDLKSIRDAIKDDDTNTYNLKKN
jgi:dsDNA-specific endonuclease/ATPase MutS2